MNKIAVIAVLVIALLLAGCASKEISVKSDKEYESKSSEKAASTSTDSKTAKTTTSKYTSPSDDVDEKPSGSLTIKDTNTGSSTTFVSQGDPFREKGLTEKCDLDYPFECARYMAEDGIVYIAIKNQDYGSKVDELTLYLDGEACDPSETFIEPGQNIDFECYVDADISYVSGSLEIEYYRPMSDAHMAKTGSLVVKME